MTLLETLVVVAILGLIAAIGFPAAHAPGSAVQLRSQAQALVADLHRARAAAQHLDRPVTLAADADGGGWRWDGGALRTDPGLRLAASQTVTFYPDGSASGGTLTLRSPARAARIDVDRVTGAAALVR